MCYAENLWLPGQPQLARYLYVGRIELLLLADKTNRRYERPVLSDHQVSNCDLQISISGNFLQPNTHTFVGLVRVPFHHSIYHGNLISFSKHMLQSVPGLVVR